jgi:hypothetical protein
MSSLFVKSLNASSMLARGVSVELGEKEKIIEIVRSRNEAELEIIDLTISKRGLGALRSTL